MHDVTGSGPLVLGEGERREGNGRALSKIGCYDDDDDAFSFGAASALIKIPLLLFLLR